MAGAEDRKYPPTPFGRFLKTMRIARADIIARKYPQVYNARIRQTDKNFRISRKIFADLCAETNKNPKVRFSEDLIKLLESGDGASPSASHLKVILEVLQIPPEDCRALEEHGFFSQAQNDKALKNTHIRPPGVSQYLFAAEFGPAVEFATKVGDYRTTWVEAHKSGDICYRPEDIDIRYLTEKIEPPNDEYKKIVEETERAMKVKNPKWEPNDTFFMKSLRKLTEANTAEEHERVRIELGMSNYTYNLVAKDAPATNYRWSALNRARYPIQPVPVLASGVGVVVSVLFDGGTKALIGQRGHKTSFRPLEYDVAVCEGMRPQADFGKNIYEIARRGLDEELGFNKSVRKDGTLFNIKRFGVFEVGCDLEFYQWNFMAFAEVEATFQELEAAWQKAKSRWENQRIFAIDFNRSSVERFITNNQIWGCGAVCLQRTFDFY